MSSRAQTRRGYDLKTWKGIALSSFDPYDKAMLPFRLKAAGEGDVPAPPNRFWAATFHKTVSKLFEELSNDTRNVLDRVAVTAL